VRAIEEAGLEAAARIALSAATLARDDAVLALGHEMDEQIDAIDECLTTVRAYVASPGPAQGGPLQSLVRRLDEAERVRGWVGGLVLADLPRRAAETVPRVAIGEPASLGWTLRKSVQSLVGCCVRRLEGDAFDGATRSRQVAAARTRLAGRVRADLLPWLLGDEPPT
jgi:hypothetical protein